MDPNTQPGQLPPTQPQLTPPPDHPAQYDFITNPGKPPKKALFSPGKGGKNGLVMVVAGGVGLLILVILLSTILFSGDSSRDVLLTVAKKQSEVIAVAQLGAEDSGTNQGQSLALAVQLAVMTEQNALIAQISKTDKVKEKDYAKAPSAEVVAQLETAQRNGRFDEVFSNVIRQELTEYQQELRTANAAVSSKSAKTLLAKDFENVGLLLSIPTN